MMLKLHQREGCPYCARVRKYMELHQIPYQAIPAPKLGSLRKELLGLEGTSSAEVPVLVDGDQVLQGSEVIVDYLEEHHRKSNFADPSYGLTRTLKGVTFADAIPAVKEALAAEGFGVLTEIDVKETLKKKIDVEFRPYLILGACNPKLAHQALQVEPGLGLLLPCNVVVTEEADGSAVVSAIDPRKMFAMLDTPGLESIAMEVRSRLSRVLAALPPEEK